MMSKGAKVAMSKGAKVAIVGGVLGLIAIGTAIAVSGKGPGGAGPVVLVNGSTGPVTVSPGQIGMDVAGGYPNGPVSLYANPSPSVDAGAPFPGPSYFTEAGTLVWYFDFNFIGTLYFGVVDLTNASVSNWVEVTAT